MEKFGFFKKRSRVVRSEEPDLLELQKPLLPTWKNLKYEKVKPKTDNIKSSSKFYLGRKNCQTRSSSEDDTMFELEERAQASTPNLRESSAPAGAALPRTRSTPMASAMGEESGAQSEKAVQNQQFIHHRVQHLIRRFAERAHRMRRHIDVVPPTPSTVSSPSASSPSTSPEKQQPSPIPLALPESPVKESTGARLWKNLKPGSALDPQGYMYIGWLFVVTICYIYNSWAVPLRASFPFQTPQNQHVWLSFDYVSDFVYLIDVALIKPRVMYLYEGFWIEELPMTRKNYMRKIQFKMDALALLPLDLLYFRYGIGAVILRVPRLLKLQTFWEFFELLDRVLASPHFVRIVRTLTYMMYMIHLNACAYYAYSVYEGIGSNRWVFSGKGHPYVRCFVFATKTATSIGKNPKPENDSEYIFMTVAWLLGVFVFALLIGQIRDIIATASRMQSEYRKLLDETLEYMRRLNVPQDLQARVKAWFTYTWETQHTLDESLILDALPINLKMDIAINVHIQTLAKVRLFADCDEALLRALVLKLRSIIYLPGDYVCRKGEVGREMYIVKTGQVQVLGSKNEVLATLSEGSVFGEISLLAINNTEGGNRRTADVKSRGFANLFVLDKDDLNTALEYYPDAQEILRKKARSLMRKNAAREREEKRKERVLPEPEVVIHNPMEPDQPPRFLQTVIEVLPANSGASQLLRHGSRRVPKKNQVDIEMTRQTKSEPCLNNSIETDQDSDGDDAHDDHEVQCEVVVHREM